MNALLYPLRCSIFDSCCLALDSILCYGIYLKMPSGLSLVERSFCPSPVMLYLCVLDAKNELGPPFMEVGLKLSEAQFWVIHC